MPYKHNESRRHKIKKSGYKVTNWHDYMTAVPELMDVAAGKFEQYARPEEVDYAD